MADKTKKITTSNGAREELRTSEIRYRRLFETAQDGILILDAAKAAGGGRVAVYQAKES